ncbi:molybdate ABC transporter, ATP-binding protein [Roseobacter sp. SK209-2-6]|uniref:molybdenum ABC transporter ATP-binding protein n=1 Tax=Roseobacter sp. SK209-2-6 TaxID=388739 RepID=UPI0000F3F537|nr:molybdenum ABC transporter ATP-binding protein [Roseobacter sp. SK209-2-6]EBA14692.1 molybdate ABC transporter, ATP-binding protein [Roseobacter sp. SK209-2-6]
MLELKLRHDLSSFTLDVCFETPSGTTVLFGGSGSGKTTVINAVAGLFKPAIGRVVLDGRVLFDTDSGIWLPPHRRRIGYIFQEGRLFPHLTVEQNLLFGRFWSPKGARREDMPKIVEMLGIGPLLNRRPIALSGGEKQRVSIGRALLSSPELLLADEPLAALDQPRKEEILPYFERLRDELNIPVLYVTHSAAEVARLATSVVVLKDGKMQRQGEAADVLADASVLPTGVRAAGALIEARVKEHHQDGLSELDAGGLPLFLPRVQQAVGQSVRLRVQAHDVILSREYPEGLSALNILPGNIVKIHQGSGPGVMISLETPAGPILARVTQRSAKAMGLQTGIACHAVMKSVAIAPSNIGTTAGQPRA